MELLITSIAWILLFAGVIGSVGLVLAIGLATIRLAAQYRSDRLRQWMAEDFRLREITTEVTVLGQRLSATIELAKINDDQLAETHRQVEELQKKHHALVHAFERAQTPAALLERGNSYAEDD